jgi:hypothetical protein
MRDQLKQLFADIERGLIQKSWVIEFSRISRDVEDTSFVKNQNSCGKLTLELFLMSVHLVLKEPGEGVLEDAPHQGRWFAMLHCLFFVCGRTNKVYLEYSHTTTISWLRS